MKPFPMTVVTEANAAFGRLRIQGFEQVAGYRLYGLDGVDKVASAEWIEADDDQAAIAAVEKMMDGHDCELWQGSRLVARLKPKRGH